MSAPQSEAELAEVIAGAREAFALRGGGTRAACYPEGAPLDLQGLRGVSLYDPSALTLVAGAGMGLDEISALLAGEGQRLGFEPPDYRKLLGRGGQPTLGGAASENAAGPRRFQAGAARDHMLGLRFVDGQGRVIRSGGRVMKNVTGYDLVKLLAGARGALGVISEIAFRLQPIPETSATLVLPGLSPASALSALRKALSSPCEVSGAAFAPSAQRAFRAGGQDLTLWLRLEGFEASLRYRLARLQDLLRGEGEADQILDPAASAAHWQRIRDLEAFIPSALVISAAIRPARLEAFLTDPALPEGLQLIADQGGGMLHLALADPTADEALALLALIRGFCAREGGHARLVKAPPGLCAGVPLCQPEPAAIAALTRGLREKFDPRGLFNSGALS